MTELRIADYSLDLPCYLLPTPAGAYYATQTINKDNICQYLLFMLSQDVSPLFMQSHLSYLHHDEDVAMQMLYRLQQLGYVQALEYPIQAEQGPLEEVLPHLLKRLSSTGKAILADEQGFYLAAYGFAHESAEQLSALSANLYEVYQRHSRLLQNNIGVKSAAFGLTDVAGSSAIGFWPLFFKQTRFSLIVADVPFLNNKEFFKIINYLAIRYGR